jgi:ATP-dependent DNA ligase
VEQAHEEELNVPAGLPFPPMEAELVDKLPESDGWQYEPKWDGFRGILENLDGELHLWSRNARPLMRYFPELAELGELLLPRSAVDGEIVVERDGALDFDALQTRLHPAESRVRKLSAEIPAGFVCFDVLLWEGEDLHAKPLEKRRAKVERLPFDVSPVTRDLEEAQRWLERLEVAGFDGVIAKKLGLPYLPGSREAVQKVKGVRTADCVVVGVTWSEKGTGIASLALGLYENGELRPVGSAPAVGKKREEILARVEPLLGPNPERKPRGAPSRWKRNADLEWSSVPPELVVEVRYDKWQKGRFRHNSRFLRFRPDKNPEQCTVDQVRPRPKKGDPTVPGLLGRGR